MNNGNCTRSELQTRWATSRHWKGHFNLPFPQQCKAICWPPPSGETPKQFFFSFFYTFQIASFSLHHFITHSLFQLAWGTLQKIIWAWIGRTTEHVVRTHRHKYFPAALKGLIETLSQSSNYFTKQWNAIQPSLLTCYWCNQVQAEPGYKITAAVHQYCALWKQLKEKDAHD